MFLFSGTFFPITFYPAPVLALMELTPLFHGVSLFRGLTTGLLQPHSCGTSPTSSRSAHCACGSPCVSWSGS